MKLLIACAMLLTSGPAFAGVNQTAVKFVDGKIILAQSYCAMCGDQRTACILKCNGAGSCIQTCDNDYLLCRQVACQYRR